MSGFTEQSARVESVDAFRVLAIFGVVIIHTTPFIDLAAKAAGRIDVFGLILNQFVRYAIPFFFTVSGYFWGLKVRREGAVMGVTIATLKRLLLLLLFWSLIYALPYDLSAIAEYGIAGPVKVAYWNIQALIRDPIDLIFSGTNQPLWFLVALCCAVAITAVFAARKWETGLLVVAALIYSCGVLALGYTDTPLGIQIGFNTLYGPFYGTLPFATGYVLSGAQPTARWFRFGLITLLIGYAIHFSEVWLLWRQYHSYPFKQYVFGTYLMGAGLATMALANKPFPGRGWMSRLGRYTLGVYLIHPIFVAELRAVRLYTHSAWWEVAYPLLVLTLAYLTVQFLMRFRPMRRFIT